jgi:hypothetical protein
MATSVDETCRLLLCNKITLINPSAFVDYLENLIYLIKTWIILKLDGRCTCEIKSRIAMAKAAFNKKRALFY